LILSLFRPAVFQRQGAVSNERAHRRWIGRYRIAYRLRLFPLTFLVSCSMLHIANEAIGTVLPKICMGQLPKTGKTRSDDQLIIERWSNSTVTILSVWRRQGRDSARISRGEREAWGLCEKLGGADRGYPL